MTNTGHAIFFGSLDDGSVIAVSIDSPRFAVGAPTREEARAKANRALKYFESVSKSLRAPTRETNVIKVISPSFKEEELAVA